MSYTDLHTHSVFCDGKSTPEEMVISAIDKGLDTLGIVVHSYTEFDKSYAVKLENEPIFLSEMARLKSKYADKIRLLAGVERDIFSTEVDDGYDYTIGSVHYIERGGEYYPLDWSADRLTALAEEHFGGDMIALCEEYYSLVSKIPEKFTPDIVGHIDLITKFNEGGVLFDTASPRYVAAYRAAVDALIPTGALFEINTGAVSRGYRTSPYPASDIIDYIKSRGGKFTLSSDAHRAENIAFGFPDFEKLL
ncbi:MAG: histidinol-phosphatase [Clostridia bacterium]|nr:histidinol-phosphatase [Clostridia bacterium]